MGNMLYSVVSGICLLVTFVLYVRIITGMARSEKRDLYVDIMMIGMIYLGLDVIWGIIYDNLLPVPLSVQPIVYAAYYSASAVLSYRWFVYVEYMQNSLFYRNALVSKIAKIPMLVVVVISVVSMWTDTFFYIKEQGQNY